MASKLLIAATVSFAALAGHAFAADDTQTVSQVVITATRVPEVADRVPADISVVSGQELRTRSGHDMASALALAPGVEAPAGGDAGPSSAVPSLWGLHEFDAFLLVVDNVPWGGAFNPMITTLDLNNVERIEVLKGSAPVMYGATSFVGVVHVIHYPAGQASNEVNFAYGNYGSARGSAALVLPSVGDFKQSLVVAGESRGFADKREKVSDGGFLYRGALDAAGGKFTVDAGVSLVRDAPPSPVIRDGTALTTQTPINANFNPAGSRIDQNQYHLALGYSRQTAVGLWESTASFTHSDIVDQRAFLHADLSGFADSQNQHRRIDDVYFDTHLTSRLAPELTLVAGADLLYGWGKQSTLNGNSGYQVPLNGSVLPPAISQIPVNEIGRVDDQRVFAGQYAQLDWKPDEKWDLTVGLRANETWEHKITSDFTTPPPALDVETRRRTITRLTETAGVSYRAWKQGADELVLYADYRNAFKPSAQDFGPDFQPPVLLPETAKSYETGLKGALAGGRFSFQAEAFQLDFRNMVVPTPSGFLTNAAAERLRGVELETRWQVTKDLAIAGNVAWHDAKFTQYLFFDPNLGASVDVAGRQLPLSPKVLASAGVIYAPAQGLNGSLVANYVGRRFLDEENTAPVSGYTTLAATLGYRAGRYGVALEGENLTNQRPPVTNSEFGSQSFYLLNARTVWLKLSYKL